MSDYRYPAVGHLACAFLPSNRDRLAKILDNMLASRDTQLEQLTGDVRDRDAAVERYMLENAELRGYVGRLRAILVDLDGSDAAAAARIARALALPIPGAGAKPKRPMYHPFSTSGRAQLCGDCDRPDVCVLIRNGTAPCGENRVVDLRVEVAK